MSTELVYEVGIETPYTGLVRGVSETQKMLRGDLYPRYGGPLRAVGHAGLGWSNVFSTTETTLGQAFQALDAFDNVGLQLDNDGLFGEVDAELTQNLTVGVDLSVGRDGAFGRDVGVNRNLIVGNDGTIGGDLVVDLTSTLTGAVGVGQAVPGGGLILGVTGNSKFTGTAWFTGDVGIKVTPSGDFGLEIADDIGPSTDDARNLGSASKQWANIYTEALTADATTLVVDKTNHRVGIGTASPAYALHGEGDFAWDVNTSVPTFFILDSGHFVGIGTATPQSALDVATGPIGVGGTATPVDGDRLWFHFNPATHVGTILGYDHTADVFRSIVANGLSIAFMASSSEKFAVNASGVRFYGTGSGGAQITGTGFGTSPVDATYGNTERDVINHMWNWLLSVGAVTT